MSLYIDAMEMTHRWRRTQLANPNAPRIMAEDWTLVDEAGQPLARIYNTGQQDILGRWRWELPPVLQD